MGKIDKLGTAIRMYNDAVKKYVETAMVEYDNAQYYLIRAEAMEELIRELFTFDTDFIFVTRRKPYPDGKRDFIYKMMVEVE
jgi:hypothetical protein